MFNIYINEKTEIFRVQFVNDVIILSNKDYNN